MGASGTTSSGTWNIGYENQNSYRNYPFSETAVLEDTDGAALASDVFVDAFLYPVVPSAPSSALKMTRLRDADGFVEVALSDEAAISGSELDGVIELFDLQGRHAGTMVCGPGWEREKASGRDRRFTGLTFSSQACCPVVHDGVMSLFDTGAGMATGTRGTRVVLYESDDQAIIPVLTTDSLGTANPRLRFDAIPPPSEEATVGIRQIIFAMKGCTVFDIVTKYGDGASPVLVSTPAFDREDVCWQAHKEDAVSIAVDVCEDGEQPSCTPNVIPEKDEAVPIRVGASGNIDILAEDLVGYKNPVVVGTVDGHVSPRTMSIYAGMSYDDILAEGAKLASQPLLSGNGIKIGIPGLKG